MLFDTDAPEKSGRGCIRAVGADLPLHASHEYEQALPVDLSRDRHVVKILFAPERLAPVHHDLRLRGQTAEIYRGRKDDPVCFANSRIYLLHLILDDTYSGVGAAAAILAWFDVHIVQPEIFDPVCLLVDAL